MNSGIIYVATNIINNKVYIGKTTKSLGRRITEHTCKTNVKKQYFRRAIDKYGKENFKWEILETIEVSLLNEREKFYISQYNSCNSKFGYNLTFGGDGAPTGELNHMKRIEYREMQRLKMINFKHTEKTKKKIRNNSILQFENGMPETTKSKISNTLMGHTAKKGSEAKMSKKYLFISPEGKLIEIIGVREFSVKNGLDHSSMVKLSKGKLKTHKGWRNGN